MNKKFNAVAVGFVSLSIALLFLSLFCELGLCKEEGSESYIKMKLGGLRDLVGNSAEIESLGRFAVQEHNKKENSILEFARVIKAKEQVVAGKLYHLTLEASDAGKKYIYEAKVWVKPWMNFKQLQEFKHAHDVPSFTASNLRIKQDGHGFGWQTMSAHETAVQDAAHHAVRTIQQRSNSMLAYELLEILLAKAEVIENYVKFDLLLKVRRGIKEEKFKVVVNKNMEGKFIMTHMEQDHS